MTTIEVANVWIVVTSKGKTTRQHLKPCGEGNLVGKRDDETPLRLEQPEQNPEYAQGVGEVLEDLESNNSTKPCLSSEGVLDRFALDIQATGGEALFTGLVDGTAGGIDPGNRVAGLVKGLERPARSAPHVEQGSVLGSGRG